MTTFDSQYLRTRVELGRLLRTARDAAGFDQASVEEEAGISHGMLSKIERAVGTLPSIKTAVRLARAVGAEQKHVRLLVIRARTLRHFRKDNVDLDELLAALSMDS